jgi:hypothetical protein
MGAKVGSFHTNFVPLAGRFAFVCGKQAPKAKPFLTGGRSDDAERGGEALCLSHCYSLLLLLSLFVKSNTTLSTAIIVKIMM